MVIPKGQKAADWVEMCEQNNWNLRQLANALGCDNFVQAQRKIKSLRGVGQCVGCGCVTHFRETTSFFCSPSCREKRGLRKAVSEPRQDLNQNADTGADVEVDPATRAKLKQIGEGRLTAYAKRVRSLPMFQLEVRKTYFT